MSSKKEISKLGRPVKYDPKFANKILEIMFETPLQGTPAHLCRALRVSRQTLWRWRKEIAEFKEAYDIGHPAVEAGYMDEMQRDPKKTGACMAVLNNLFEWRKEGGGGDTTINVSNMNVLNATPPKELLERARELIGQLNGQPEEIGRTPRIIDSDRAPEEV